MDEALTRAQRIKRGRIMKQKAGIIARKRKISMKRRASTDKLKTRAKKKARDVVAKRLVRGKDKSDMSFAERENLEKKLAKKKGLISKIAKKLMPKVKAAEKDRLKKLRSKK